MNKLVTLSKKEQRVKEIQEKYWNTSPRDFELLEVLEEYIKQLKASQYYLIYKGNKKSGKRIKDRLQ